MLRNYIQTAMHRARYEILPDDGTFYGEILECRGVFANAETLEACREQLEGILEDWIFLRLHRGLEIPVIGKIELVVRETASRS